MRLIRLQPAENPVKHTSPLLAANQQRLLRHVWNANDWSHQGVAASNVADTENMYHVLRWSTDSGERVVIFVAAAILFSRIDGFWGRRWTIVLNSIVQKWPFVILIKCLAGETPQRVEIERKLPKNYSYFSGQQKSFYSDFVCSIENGNNWTERWWNL